MEDKSWMTMDRLSTKYANGVETFISYAEDGAEDLNSIRCPCTECDNLFKMGLNDIRYHLLRYGIKPSYTRWVWHGEGEQSEGSSTESIYQDHGVDMDDATNTIDMFQAVNEDFVGNPEKFQNLLEDAEKPLYGDCRKYTKLSAVVKLFNIKAKASWSDKSFSDVLTLFADMLPENNELPLSTREAKRILFAFGMEYKKIHACSNDCILYRKEYEHAIVCPTCGMPRYKAKENVQEEVNDRRGKGVPAKVLWYFSPIPRFKRWFQSTQTAKDLTWHASGRDIDGKLRHPVDSPMWKLIDDKWPEFASESRNLRLAISADGINPHSSLSSRYSCWPVMLNTYITSHRGCA